MSTPEHQQKRKDIKQRRKFHIHKIKRKFGCEECGYNEDGHALCFDHIDPMTKGIHCTGGIGGQGGGMNGYMKRMCIRDKEKNRRYIRELFNEMRKCRVLCMNCHTIQTMKNGEHKRCVETYENRTGRKFTNVVKKIRIEEIPVETPKKIGKYSDGATLGEFL